MRRKEKRTIKLEIPSDIPEELRPNRSRYTHWGKVTSAKNRLQKLVYAVGYDARQRYEEETGETWVPMEAGVIHYTFIVKDRRSIQDDDNAVGAMKALRDELMMEKKGKIAGCRIIVDDRQFTTGAVNWEVDKERAPLIIVTIEEVL